MNAKARCFWQNTSPRPRRTCRFRDWQELCWCNALRCYLAVKEDGCCAASEVWSRTCTYHSASAGRRETGITWEAPLCNKHLQQVLRTSSAEVFADLLNRRFRGWRWFWEHLNQAVTSLFAGVFSGRLDCSTVGTEIIKSLARPLLTKSEQHFAWSQEKAVISQLLWLQARIQKRLTKPC